MLGIAFSARASDRRSESPKEKYGLRVITYSSLRPGDYVRLAFGKKQIIISGMVEKVKPDRISIDLSLSEEGLAGITTIRRKEILWLRRLPPPSPAKVEKLREGLTKEAEAARKALKAYRERIAKEELAEEEAVAKISPEKVPPGLTPEQLRLLADFPPEEGWGLAKFNDIRRNWIIYDLPPTDKERNFLEIFPRWNDAYKALLQSLPPETPGKGTSPSVSPGEKYKAPPLPEPGTERGKVRVEKSEQAPAEEPVTEEVTGQR